MGMIIDGKLVSASIKDEVKQKVVELEQKYGSKPKLVVFYVGEDKASAIYVNNKEKACNQLGILSEVVRLSEEISEEELIKAVNEKVNDDSVNGILVQLPLPKKFDEKKILSLIPWYKDVDGLTEKNVAKLVLNEEGLFPCTPMGVVDLMKYYNIDPCGKNVVVVGRSILVGKPLMMLLTNLNATVTLCHSRTQHLDEITRRADIIVMAIGKPRFLTQNMVNKDSIIFDVGINRLDDGKICGDCDFDNLIDNVQAITKVPGGCGPMTIAELMKNTVKCFEIQHKDE